VIEKLILFWGWTRNEKSYQNLINTAPPNWQIQSIPYEDLVPNGNTAKLNQAILEFLAKRQLDKVNLAGHSLGGALALLFAHDHPEKVKGLFLLDSEGIPGHETITEMFKNFYLSHTSHARKKIIENTKAILRIIKKPILHLRLAQFAHNIDIQRQAQELKTPTVIIWGEKDRIVPLWQGQKLHELIPNSKFLILKDMDHDWVIYNPEKFWQNIR